jgi:G3E family GTPase
MNDDSEGDSALPVTLLTGFLGAGKTTLLNRLLRAGNGQRIAVVENEFGAVGIDGGLVDRAAVSVVELSNGCICCSVQGELGDALRGLIARRDAGELMFDRLVIECTGLADPAPVVQTFFHDATLRERYRLDGVVTVIDAVHVDQQFREARVAASQIAFADRLIISRADLVTPEQLDEVVARMQRVNARAPIIVAGSADEDWRDLFAIGGFTLNEKGLPAAGWQPVSPRAQPAFGGAQHTSWDDAVGSLVLESESPLDLDRVGAFVGALIAEHSADLLRYKGILSIVGEARRLIFQGVHKVAGFDYGRPWEEGERRTSRIVLIGRHLPADVLRASFDATCALADAAASSADAGEGHIGGGRLPPLSHISGRGAGGEGEQAKLATPLPNTARRPVVAADPHPALRATLSR